MPLSGILAVPRTREPRIDSIRIRGASSLCYVRCAPLTCRCHGRVTALKIKISLKSLCIGIAVLAVLFAGIGMARRNSLRYRAEGFASLNAGTLPADISGDYVLRYHPAGGWDTKLTLNDDGTFSAVQEKGGQASLKGNGKYSIDGRVVSLRYRHRPRGWNTYADFKWAVILRIEGEIVLVPDQSCEDYLVGEDALAKQGGLWCRNYLTRKESIDTVQELLREFVRDNLKIIR